MVTRLLVTAAMLPALVAPQANARTSTGSRGGELPAVLQCVPYARDVTGIQIYGDAHTWWHQAAGRFKRGNTPRAGAVMAVRPHGNSRLGHVAAVSSVLDSRTVLLRHANWSAPGKIEDGVKAVDVSASNDWSKVRIWHGPSQALGTSHWPVAGFIYNQKANGKSVSGAYRIAKRRGQSRSSGGGASASNDFIADVIAGRVR